MDMAKEVESMDTDRVRGRRARYPWAQWTNGKVWLLERGEDYTTSDEVMRSVVHAHARRKGLVVATTLASGGMKVQFSSPAPKVRRIRKIRKPKP